ncbi:MAG: amino acid ABC transporter permease [Eubacteriales Family XIII. Incertae Sedis bacterium]|nr:MAG: amino acid ABC transporter permease [Clostridiales Family XIII bacterium]PWM68091.1 MAG: amino acid ABC transporter permease [Clostridiales Family XIII bacterium]PWM68244.1 MAG: amino acid ABC transporter permease [Clostridiales Family XIII bacterium]
MDYVGILMPTLLAGAWVMVQLFCWTLLLSLPLGLPIALGSNVRFWPIRAFCRFYVFVFRGTPLLLQLYFFYFLLPIQFDIRLPALTTSIITFVLNYAAYFAEIYRGGINGIDRGQYEAAKALGLSKMQTMVGIVLPQTMKIILPPVSNEAIVLVKDTALASAIGLGELMKASKGAVNRDVDPTAYFVVAVIYLMFTFILTLASNRLEKRFKRYDERAVS